MKENKPIELRSEKVRNIIGRMPSVFVRYGTVMIAAALLVLAAVAAFIPYQPKISIEINAIQDDSKKIHYTARIPQQAMAQRGNFVLITGSPPVEGFIATRFVFHDVPDTVSVSGSGGWLEMEVYPINNDARAVKISEPFTFAAKIELKYTTFWKWIVGKM